MELVAKKNLDVDQRFVAETLVQPVEYCQEKEKYQQQNNNSEQKEWPGVEGNCK